MEKYLDNYDNPIAQILNEFLMFLFVIQHDCKSNKMLHNVLIESQKIHTRALCEFFLEERKYRDDIIYKDLITSKIDLTVSMNNNVRDFINKSSAHISRQRGKIKIPHKEFKDLQKGLIKSINLFINEMDCNLKSNYVDYYRNEDVQKMRMNVLTQILTVVTRNAQDGILVKL